MEWSGRAPAPPASDAGMGRVSNGASPCPTNQPRPLPRWAGGLGMLIRPQSRERYGLKPWSELDNPAHSRRSPSIHVRAVDQASPERARDGTQSADGFAVVSGLAAVKVAERAGIPFHVGDAP